MKTTTRIIQRSFASLIQGARLDSYREEKDKIILGVQGFQPISSKLLEREGKIHEQVRAKHIPLTLTFTGISKLKRDDFFTSLDSYSLDDSSRIIAYMYSWRQPRRTDIFHMFGLRLPVGADMQFFAQNVKCERVDSPSKPFIVERDWSPAPPMPNRTVPKEKAIYKTFGGDPISIQLRDKNFHSRLFIGGVNIQPKKRPRVDAVLNLGEESSRWVKKGQALDPRDRAVEHGEGSQGMTIEQIREEAGWAIERLKQNQSVLVHCVAGMNRSTTVACAALILLEGLSAEDALARVREHHPWARPDSHHWLALRWLAKVRRKNK
ncbi:MAG: dual specificity protein phosphatase family protein [Anaerolineales bacterium]|nr:dual specificity protein phosphatase family protein [Anaerolineales bacterium]